jgi:hypothetical protein
MLIEANIWAVETYRNKLEYDFVSKKNVFYTPFECQFELAKILPTILLIFNIFH